MRVGVFFQKIKPEAGGGFTFQDDVIRALIDLSAASRHSFVIFTNLKSEQPPIAAGDGKIEFVHLPWTLRGITLSILRKAYRYIPLGYHQPGLLRKYLLKYHIDFFWFLTPHSYCHIDVPYITIVWDLQHRLQPWFPEVSAQGEWDNRERYYQDMLQRAACVITGNEAGKNEIRQFYHVPPERIQILPLPTPSFSLQPQPAASPTILEKHGISGAYLFYPAQFWAHKNHYLLFRALAYLRDEWNITVPLVLTGADKGNLAYLQELTRRYDLQPQVHSLGFVSREALICLYQHALALVYPSYFGPENLPPLEAFALGCPVIAADVSGAPEQFGDAALLFDPRNHVHLARAVKSLGEDPNLRRTLISRGKDRAARWTAEDFVRGVLTILDDFAPIRHCWPAAAGDTDGDVSR